VEQQKELDVTVKNDTMLVNETEWPAIVAGRMLYGECRIMSERLGILFLHHQVDAVVKEHLRRLRKHNPGATVVTMSSGKPLPNGYTLEPTPRLQWLHSLLVRRSSDQLVCSWFVQRKEVCDKWWIVDAGAGVLPSGVGFSVCRLERVPEVPGDGMVLVQEGRAPAGGLRAVRHGRRAVSVFNVGTGIAGGVPDVAGESY
jgi:hypothetical protein